MGEDWREDWKSAPIGRGEAEVDNPGLKCRLESTRVASSGPFFSLLHCTCV